MGVLSLVDSVSLLQSGSVREEILHYGLFNYKELMGRVAAGYKNTATGVGCDHTDFIYRNYLHQLDETSGGGGIPVGSADFISEQVWLEMPLNLLLMYFGWAPMYQLGTSLSIQIRLANKNAPWAESVPTPVKGQQGGIDGSWSCDTYSKLQDNRASLHLDHDGLRGDQDMSFIIYKALLGLDTLKAGLGATLDANDVSVPYESVFNDAHATYGYKEESVVSLLKRSSITKASAIFVSQDAWTSQDWAAGTLAQWPRASIASGPEAATAHVLGAVSRKADMANRYDTSINYWYYMIGDEMRPTANGAGQPNPPNVDDNTVFWYNDYCAYHDRPTTTERNRLAIEPYSERNHPLVSKNVFTRWLDQDSVGNQSTGTPNQFWFNKHYIGCLGELYTMNGGENSVVGAPTFANMFLGLYRGGGYRWRFTNASLDPENVGTNMYAYQFIDWLSGGQFIAAVVLAPLSSFPDLLRGVDLEYHPLKFGWTRNTQILFNQDRSIMGEYGHLGKPGTANMITIQEQYLTLILSISYQGIATIGQGMFSLKDFIHF